VGRSKVRSDSLLRVMRDGKISWAQGPKVCVILHLAQLLSKVTLVLLKEKKKKPEGETPALVALESYRTGILTSLDSSGSCHQMPRT